MEINKKTFATHKKRWQKMVKMWQEFTEPGRPSKNDIFNYNFLVRLSLKGKKNPKIIVLGSTPEIRDMLYKYTVTHGAKIICIDMIADTYNAMTRLVENKNEKEVFIKSNWLEIDLPQKSVDLIIGDFVIDNLTTDLQDRFLSKISSLLLGDGNFITRDTVSPKSNKAVGIENLLHKYAKMVAEEKITIKQAANWLSQNLIWNSVFRSKADRMSLKYYERDVKILKSKLKKGTLEYEIFVRFLKSWWPMKDKYWTMHGIETENKMLRRHFVIEKILYSDDHDLIKFAPIYFLKNNN